MALTQMGEYEEALKAYDVTLRQKPNHAGAMGNKAFILLDLGRTAEAEQLLRAALALEPNDCELRNREAIFHFWTGQCEQSVEILRQVLRTNPQHVETHKHLGLILLLMSQYKEGFAEYEWRMRDKTNVRREHALPQWDGSPLAGRTLLLETEQGIGDTIQFVRYAAAIKRLHNCRIIVACDPPLFQFLEGVPGVDVLLKQNEKSRPPFDVWAPLLSVPGISRA
jgi:tetratricopeptide (TPR) repeat protein